MQLLNSLKIVPLNKVVLMHQFSSDFYILVLAGFSSFGFMPPIKSVNLIFGRFFVHNSFDFV